MHTCPVCGYNGLQSPPENFTICPSCYTEFGYDDASLSHEELRREWIRNGMRWEASNITPPPFGWNPVRQLLDAGFGYDMNSLSSEPKVYTVDLGQRLQQIIIVADSLSFKVNLKSRLIALGNSRPNLRARIHPASASA